MVWSPGTVSVEFRDVPQRHFNTLLARYTEVKYQFKHFFFMNIKFDEILSEIDNV